MNNLTNPVFIAAAAITIGAFPALAEEHRVEIVSDYSQMRLYFSPKSLTIQPGDTVVWVNLAEEEHNVMSYPGGFPKDAKGFQSDYLTEAGETFTQKFTTEGTYQYHCLPHLLMGMNGEIIVGRHSRADEFHEPTQAEISEYRKQLLSWFDEDDNLYQVRQSDKSNKNEAD